MRYLAVATDYDRGHRRTAHRQGLPSVHRRSGRRLRTLRDVVPLGNQWRSPNVHECLAILGDPKINLSINLLGIALHDRPAFFAQLVPNLQAMRARTGRPHWLVLDEAHHLLPDTWGHAAAVLPQKLHETLLVTVHPEHVAPSVLAPIDAAVAIGHAPQDTLAGFAKATGRALAWPNDLGWQSDRVVVWRSNDIARMSSHWGLSGRFT